MIRQTRRAIPEALKITSSKIQLPEKKVFLADAANSSRVREMKENVNQTALSESRSEFRLIRGGKTFTARSSPRLIDA